MQTVSSLLCSAVFVFCLSTAATKALAGSSWWDWIPGFKQPLLPPSHQFSGLQCISSQCSIAEESLRFLILGDWGGQKRKPFTTPNQLAVAKQLAQTAREMKPHFLLNVGDNFYDGIKTDVNDKRFQVTYEEVYTDRSLHLPWYMMAGNHDYDHNLTAQIAYTQKSNRWIFPSVNYTIGFEAHKFSAKIVVIDTMVLCGIADTDGVNETDPDHPDPIPTGPDHPHKAKRLLQWVEHELNESRNIDYLFVAGHFNIWGARKGEDIPCMLDTVDPLLHKYGVSAYISGHKHNLQHLEVSGTNKTDKQTIQYLLSGAGGRILTGKQKKLGLPHDRAVAESRFFHGNKGKPGFVTAELHAKHGRFNFLNSDGKVLYSFKLSPRTYQ